MKSLDILLSSILNGQRRRKLVVHIPYSRTSAEIARILVEEGYLRGVYRDDTTLKVLLRYHNNSPGICGVRRVSRPGRRVYSPAKKLPKPQQGLAIAIISTTSGLLCDREARQSHVGGEVMCYVW